MQYPRDDKSFIAWARQRADTWTGGQSGPPDIGLSAAQASAFDLLVSAGEAALASHISAQANAVTKTDEKNISIEAIKEDLGGLISTIEAHAKTTKDPGVYARAQLKAPKDPGKRPAPEAPVITSAQLVIGGTTEVRFAVVTGGSAVFDVQRYVTPLEGSPSGWSTVASITDKVFRDQAVPYGQRSVTYRVRARLTNGSTSGWSNEVGVNLGTPAEEVPGAPVAGSIGGDGDGEVADAS